ncbi:uncharacterized protein RCO7_15036 [Rhynchosporium graminicola]|uniref:Uncharacterized protein n=1 Tax=Rhynchosporium graminicola TaxID=2792576 RepID=A0A1E1LGP7_9HELO|nr:uncharacterized protein RCO7_15036 [Rhynchosporium commune]
MVNPDLGHCGGNSMSKDLESGNENLPQPELEMPRSQPALADRIRTRDCVHYLNLRGSHGRARDS